MLSLRPLSTTDPLTRTDVWLAAALEIFCNAAFGVSAAMWFGPVGLGGGDGIADGDGVALGLALALLGGAAADGPEDPPPHAAANDTATTRRAGRAQRRLMWTMLVRESIGQASTTLAAAAVLPLMRASRR
jgi:hypothetical protein